VSIIAVAIVLVVLLVILVGTLVFFMRRPLPRTRGTVHLPGLKGPVEVIRDRWGVPHIYADSAEGLFWAQGYVHQGPYSIGGDHDTLLRASGQPLFPFEPVLVGDAMRFIVDLSDWEKCRIVIPGGQSGHVASRHYADLIPLWLQGRFQPMPFQRAAVERHGKRRLTLLPEGFE